MLEQLPSCRVGCDLEPVRWNGLDARVVAECFEEFVEVVGPAFVWSRLPASGETFVVKFWLPRGGETYPPCGWLGGDACCPSSFSFEVGDGPAFDV